MLVSSTLKDVEMLVSFYWTSTRLRKFISTLGNLTFQHDTKALPNVIMDTFYKKLRNDPGCALLKLVDRMLGKQLEASEGAHRLQI